MSLIKEYFELTRKYQSEYGDNTIVLMQVGAFMEVYGLSDKNNTITCSKIEDFSKFCDLNVVRKNATIDGSHVVMAGHKDIFVEKYIKKMQEAGFTVVVYMQDDAVKNTTRSLAGIFSPGTFFSTDSTTLTNNITCIWVELVNNTVLLKGKYIVVGIANIDIYTGKSNIFQFREAYTNNPTNYDELERFISIYNPNEVILISNLQDNEINKIINYTDIKCKSIHKINLNDDNDNTLYKRARNTEKQSYQSEILNKFYQFDDYDVFVQNFNENNIATQSFCFLLDFVFQHNPNLVNKIDEPVFDNQSECLILANHSLKQLNIIDDDNSIGKYSSVSKMLNCCLTPMGKRKFNNIFLNPTTNITYLEREYSITEYMISNYDKYSDILRSNLPNIKDLSKLCRQVYLKKMTPKIFYNLYYNILIIKDIYDIVIRDPVIKGYLNNFENDIDKIGDFCNNITSFIKDNIDLDISKDIDMLQQFDQNFIKSGVDELLDLKTTDLRQSEIKLESIKNYLNVLIENKEKNCKTVDFVKIYETEKNNFSLLCTNRRCKLLEDALPVKHTVVKIPYDSNEFELIVSKSHFSFNKQSASNNCIVHEQITKLCKNISNIKVSMKDIITQVFNTVITKFEYYHSSIECISNFVTLIDVIFAKSSIAKKYNYCRPKIEFAEKSFIKAKKVRHCLIEQFQTGELYVTNDINIGDAEPDGILLYGTNAVGKTSFIRSIGISLIMAQAGLYVACSEFTYMPYNYIFTRILGNDNLFKGLSTFAVEMSELRTILRLADKNSLVLGDELCSGTENTSAISIFVAGVQKLHNCKCSFIFATHLHEIVNYDEIRELKTLVLKHMSVLYDKERDLLIYDRKLKDGPGDSMYGLEVCKSLKLPEDFLTNAYNIRMKYNPEAGSILSLKTSHFNSKKIMSICELCKENIGSEVHHLQHQSVADNNGFINNSDMTFNKNNIANLMTLCEKCHNNIHTQKVQHKRVKTTKGFILHEL